MVAANQSSYISEAEYASVDLVNDSDQVTDLHCEFPF